MANCEGHYGQLRGALWPTARGTTAVIAVKIEACFQYKSVHLKCTYMYSSPRQGIIKILSCNKPQGKLTG